MLLKVNAQQVAVTLRILHDVIPDLVTQNDPVLHEIGPFVEIITVNSLNENIKKNRKEKRNKIITTLKKKRKRKE